MKELSHPNVIELYGVWETESEVILVMEFAASGMLFNTEWLRRGLTPPQGVAHRDLKPENVLLMETGTLNPAKIKFRCERC